MPTTVTTINDTDWHAVATGPGEFLIEIELAHYLAFGATAPAADATGYRGDPLAREVFVMPTGRSVWVRSRGSFRPFVVVATSEAM